MLTIWRLRRPRVSNVEHTFAIPLTAPYLDYRSLQAYLGHRSERKIGTAVNIQRGDAGFDFRIRFTLFACVYMNEVVFFYPFSPNGSPTEEQRAWIDKLANDNGVGHLLGAAGVPVLSLFGPTDPARWRPVTPDGQILRAADFGGEDVSAIPSLAVVEAVLTMARRLEADQVPPAMKS